MIRGIQDFEADGLRGPASEEASPLDQTEISKAAELLADKHGRDADMVAALRADALFRAGNSSEGTRWLRIFRRVAMSHLGRGL